MRVIKQSTAAVVMILMVDSTDHVTGKTGLALTVTLSKNGGVFAAITPTVTERSAGWYSLALTASHTDTLGDLAIHVTAAGADPSDRLLAVETASNTTIQSVLSSADTTINLINSWSAWLSDDVSRRLPATGAHGYITITSFAGEIAVGASITVTIQGTSQVYTQEVLPISAGDYSSLESNMVNWINWHPAVVSSNDTFYSAGNDEYHPYIKQLNVGTAWNGETISIVCGSVLNASVTLTGGTNAYVVVDTTLTANHGAGSWAGATTEQIDAALTASHGAGTWVAPTTAQIDSALTAAHGAGPWTGPSSPVGTGDTAVDHNTGGADNLRYLSPTGTPIDNGSIVAYLTAEYDAKNYTNPIGATTSRSDGRFSAPLMLDAGVSYTIMFYKQGFFMPTVAVITP